MTQNDIDVLMDMAAQTVGQMGLVVKATTLNGQLALAYGSTVTSNSERAFQDFQAYAEEAHEAMVREEAENEQAYFAEQERLRETAGGYSEDQNW